MTLLSEDKRVQRVTAHLTEEIEALYARLELGQQVKIDPEIGLKNRALRAERDRQFLLTEAWLLVERLRSEGRYDLSDPMRDALLQVENDPHYPWKRYD